MNKVEGLNRLKALRNKKLYDWMTVPAPEIAALYPVPDFREVSFDKLVEELSEAAEQVLRKRDNVVQMHERTDAGTDPRDGPAGTPSEHGGAQTLADLGADDSAQPEQLPTDLSTKAD